MIDKSIRAFLIVLVLTTATLVAQHPTMDPKSDTVPTIDYGEGPLTPTIDDYYLEGNPDEFIPDEFMSNPSGEVDPTALEGYHFPPLLKWVRVVSDRQIEAGGTIRLEAQAESPAAVRSWWIAYQSPFGRRTTFRANFTPPTGQPLALRRCCRDR